MPAEVRLSPKDRRTVLAQLSRHRLGELTALFELDVADRRLEGRRVSIDIDGYFQLTAIRVSAP